jgi:hypothetical protein
MVGDAELQSSIDRDLLELARAGPSDEVDIVVAVQERSSGPTTWLAIESPGRDKPREPIKTATQPSGTARRLHDRLTEFLTFVAGSYPSEHYLLVMWGHASGLEFGHFEPGSERDRLGLRQLSRSLHAFALARKNHTHSPRDDEGRQPGTRLDILGFCACAVSKAEFALELRDEVDYLVSSQVGISTLMTWPFDEIAQLVVRSPSVRPETLASQMVQCFEEFYEPPPVALTALDLKESETLRKQVDDLAELIIRSLNVPKDRGLLNNLCVLSAFKKSIAAYPYELEPLVDFYDFCRKLVEEEALEAEVRDLARQALDRGVRSIVVCHARSGPKLGALHGLSILAPDLDDPELPAIIKVCSESRAWLWQKTRWVAMVRQVHEFALSRPDLG